MELAVYILIIFAAVVYIYPFLKIVANRIIMHMTISHLAGKNPSEYKLIKGKRCRDICSSGKDMADYILISSSGIYVIKLMNIMNTHGMLNIYPDGRWMLFGAIPVPIAPSVYRKKIHSHSYVTELAAQVESKLWNTASTLECIPVLVFCPSPAGVFFVQNNGRNSNLDRIPIGNGDTFSGITFTTVKRFKRFIKNRTASDVPDNKVVDNKIKEIEEALLNS